MTHPEAAREAAEDGQDGGEMEEMATVTVSNSASDKDMVETKGWSGQGNSGEDGSVHVNGVTADDVERSGEVCPRENGCRNGDIARESHEAGVPADCAQLDVDKGDLAEVKETSMEVNVGGGVVLEDEQELAADTHEEEEEEAEDGAGNREENGRGDRVGDEDDKGREKEKVDEEEEDGDDEDGEEADDVVSETLFRQPSLRGRHDVPGENLNSSLGMPGEEREERENTFAEDREPTPSFVEEQGGDRFDMDCAVVSTLYSAGTRGSSTIPGARFPRRNLSGGLLGTKARRSYSRQSSGNLKSLETQEGWTTDNASWATGTRATL